MLCIGTGSRPAALKLAETPHWALPVSATVSPEARPKSTSTEGKPSPTIVTVPVYHLRGHPFQAPVQHVDLVGHLEFEIGHLAFLAGHVAADPLADHPAHGLAQVRRPLVLDVGGLERVGLDSDAARPACPRPAARRTATSAACRCRRRSTRIRVALDDVRKELVEQPVLRGSRFGTTWTRTLVS